MIWGSGRLLFRAASSARSRSGFRVVRVLRRSFSAVRARPIVAAWLSLAIVGGAALCLVPGSGTRLQSLDIARSATVTVDEPAQLGTGTVAVSAPVEQDEPHYSPGTIPSPPVGQRFALLVGIDNAAGAPALPGTLTDVANTKQALLEYGFPPQNIATLVSANATRANILHGLDALVAEAPASGIAVVLIAGHSRRYGGIEQLLTADGQRVNSTEIAARLQGLRSRAWIAIATCFAGGYALPGIVGPGRVATFASNANSEAYDVGSDGSYMIMGMVHDAMLERRAPESVESAFSWAQASIEKTTPDRVPLMSDGVAGDLVLGQLSGDTSAAPAGPQQGAGYQAAPPAGGDDPSSGDPSDSNGQDAGSYRTLSVCGRANYNCSSSP